MSEPSRETSPSKRRPRARRSRKASAPGGRTGAPARTERVAALGRIASRVAPRARALLWGGAGLAGTLVAATAALLLGFGTLGGLKRGAGGAAVPLEWPKGLDEGEGAALLASLGFVHSQDAMALFLRVAGGSDRFVPGPHLLPDGASPWELRRLLSRAPGRPTARLVVPEGWNRFDIAGRLEKLGIAGKSAFLAASADTKLLDRLGIERSDISGAASAEGYLFPATYELAANTHPEDALRRLVSESDKRWEALSARHAGKLAALRASLGWGRREVLTLASMVEKEAAVDEERPVIASVFLNRLLDPSFRPKRLQSDPTSAYGCLVAPDEAPSCAGFTGKPTPAVNTDPRNRYSTYAHAGLPPGPIANPGARSIEAVLAPADTRYLYFVASGGGRHAFSESIDAHNQAVRRLRAAAATQP